MFYEGEYRVDSRDVDQWYTCRPSALLGTFQEAAVAAACELHASREEMLGSTLFLVGVEVSDGSYIQQSSSCSMCKRLIINAGIEKVVIRDTRDEYRVIPVSQWVEQDESIDGIRGY